MVSTSREASGANPIVGLRAVRAGRRGAAVWLDHRDFRDRTGLLAPHGYDLRGIGGTWTSAVQEGVPTGTLSATFRRVARGS